MANRFFNNLLGTGGSSFDPDAQAFITAAGITDPTQQGAIDTLVVGLKADLLWTKMDAIYPFVGGTATTHKYNLKDPRDLDAAFRLNFAGGWTHSSTGGLPNGTTAYADTFLVPSTTLALNSTHLSYYSRTAAVGDAVEIGCCPAGFNPLTMFGFNASGSLNFDANNSGAGNTAATPATANSFGITSRTASTTSKAYINGAEYGSSASVSTSRPSFSVYVGARNNNGVAQTFSSKECAFASIGAGLDGTEAANFYTNVQAFQTTLSRQV